MLGGLGLLVSGAALLVTFTDVQLAGGLTLRPRVGWAELSAALGGARVPWLAGYAALNVASLAVRALQLRALARRRDGEAPRASATWHAVSIGMLAQNLLPARLGEAARVVALMKADDVAPGQAAAAAVLARVLDLVALIAVTCFPVLLLGLDDAHPSLGRVARVASALGALLVGALIVLYRHRAAAARLGHRLRPAVGRAVSGFAEGLSALAAPRRLASAALWSLVAPVLVAACYACALTALGLDGLPRGTALLFTATVFFAVAIPSAPSSLGVYHAAATWILGTLGAAPAQAAAFAILTHAIGATVFIALGLVSTLRVGASLLAPAPDAAEAASS